MAHAEVDPLCWHSCHKMENQLLAHALHITDYNFFLFFFFTVAIYIYIYIFCMLVTSPDAVAAVGFGTGNIK